MNVLVIEWLNSSGKWLRICWQFVCVWRFVVDLEVKLKMNHIKSRALVYSNGNKVNGSEITLLSIKCNNTNVTTATIKTECCAILNTFIAWAWNPREWCSLALDATSIKIWFFYDPCTWELCDKCEIVHQPILLNSFISVESPMKHMHSVCVGELRRFL